MRNASASELVGCIQTLGHLEQIIKWGGAYDKVRDTASVLLVDEPKTYALIEKMIAFWSEALGSRRIHIGMDETHDLGRGRFLDKFGYESGFELFNRHLGKVNELCKKAGLAPMIWSDMYFRLSNADQNYYDLEHPIPDSVQKKIPQNVQLVYWDYYHEDAAMYEAMIRRHRDIGFEPVMGSGIWTWTRLWYDHAKTEKTAVPCIQACRKQKVSELFFTMWATTAPTATTTRRWPGSSIAPTSPTASRRTIPTSSPRSGSRRSARAATKRISSPRRSKRPMNTAAIRH